MSELTLSGEMMDSSLEAGDSLGQEVACWAFTSSAPVSSPSAAAPPPAASVFPRAAPDRK